MPAGRQRQPEKRRTSEQFLLYGAAQRLLRPAVMPRNHLHACEAAENLVQQDQIQGLNLLDCLPVRQDGLSCEPLVRHQTHSPDASSLLLQQCAIAALHPFCLLPASGPMGLKREEGDTDAALLSGSAANAGETRGSTE